MQIWAGLGNPGAQYAMHRHNVGFMTADVMAEVMVTDLRGDLRQIQAPVDVVYAWDKVSPASKMGLDQVYASAYAGLAQGRLHRIDEARHYVMLDQPDAFYGAVNGWLAR